MSQRISLVALAFVGLVVAAAMPSQSTGQTNNNESSARIRKLLQERRDVMAQRVEYFDAQFRNAKVTRVPVLEARDDLIAAEIDLAETRQERIELLRTRVANRKEVEESCIALRTRAIVDTSDVLQATSQRLLAEIELERAIGAE
jgi:hypothetical protein